MEELDEPLMNELVSLHVEEEVPDCMYRSREALEWHLQSATGTRARRIVSMVNNIILDATNAVSEAADAITAVELSIEAANNSVATANNKIATAKDALGFYNEISGNAEDAIPHTVNAVSNIDNVRAENAMANNSNAIPVDDNATVVTDNAMANSPVDDNATTVTKKAIPNAVNADSNIDNVSAEIAIPNTNNVTSVDDKATSIIENTTPNAANAVSNIDTVSAENAIANTDNDVSAKANTAPSNAHSASSNEQPELDLRLWDPKIWQSLEKARRCGFKKAKPVFEKNKPQISIVVMGHANSGKSTTMTHLLYKVGDICEDDSTRAENEVEAMNQNMSHQYAWVLDKLESERIRGITTEITLGMGTTNKYVCTFIDVPGHHEFRENMIAGTLMADYAIFIIDSTDEGFESGMNSKTLEQAFIAFNLGVKDIICCLNKMDEITPEDSQGKYNKIMESVRSQLKIIGYEKVPFIPISGLKGDNITESSMNLDWYKGDTLIKIIDKLKDPVLLRTKSKDGRAKEAVNFYEIGVIKRGSVASSSKEVPAQESVEFTAKVVILSHRDGIQNGYKTMLNFHGYQFSAKFSKIVSKIENKSEKVIEEDPKILNIGDAGLVIMTSTKPEVIATFSNYSPLGCFAVLELDRTVAFGVIKSVKKKEMSPAEKQI